MKTIKFAYDFEKLPEGWENTKAVLGAFVVKPVMQIVDSWGKFLDYDTKIRNESERRFIVDFEHALVLFFVHLKSGKVFATLRKYNDGNFKKYCHSVGEPFLLIKSIGE